jgi:hypothetical protein
MADPEKVSPQWTEGEAGASVTSDAIVSLGPPHATPDGPRATLYLDIEQNEEETDNEDDIESPGYVWRYGVGEEESGFGEAEYEHGRAPTLEEAKDDCWDAVAVFLRGEGYSDYEILNAV